MTQIKHEPALAHYSNKHNTMNTIFTTGRLDNDNKKKKKHHYPIHMSLGTYPLYNTDRETEKKGLTSSFPRKSECQGCQGRKGDLDPNSRKNKKLAPQKLTCFSVPS